MAETNPAVTTDTPQRRGKATSVEKAAEGQRQDGTGDHRVLLRGRLTARALYSEIPMVFCAAFTGWGVANSDSQK